MKNDSRKTLDGRSLLSLLIDENFPIEMILIQLLSLGNIVRMLFSAHAGERKGKRDYRVYRYKKHGFGAGALPIVFGIAWLLAVQF